MLVVKSFALLLSTCALVRAHGIKDEVGQVKESSLLVLKDETINFNDILSR